MTQHERFSGGAHGQCYISQKNAEAENEENASEREKHLGNPIYYGQTVQLRHQFTDKYIHVSTEKMARVDKTEMRVRYKTLHRVYSYVTDKRHMK